MACTVKHVKAFKWRYEKYFKITFRITPRHDFISIVMYTEDANKVKSSGEADQCLHCLLEFICLETLMVFTSN